MAQAHGTFIDLFAGCGGLSLGLMIAGWRGLFAVEQDALAFETLKYNLLNPDSHCPHKYDWPNWLEKTPTEISQFIANHSKDLSKLHGTVDLVVGGPPCQGFSMAGRRKLNDPRNELFKHYVKLVSIIQPPFLLLENVRGIAIAFRKQRSNDETGVAPRPFAERIKTDLEREGYEVFTRLVRSVELAVPQLRPRYILLAIRSDLLQSLNGFDPFHDFDKRRKTFVEGKGFTVDRPVTVKQALSDLETVDTDLVECVDSAGFKQIIYTCPRTKYQRLMHGTLNGTAPNSLRLANHRDETRIRFEQIITSCRKGVQMSAADRKRFGMKKHCFVPLDANQPSHTLTTLPDDFLHYSEPRILTVREYARLQSFPDWYEFHGKYTTGGDRRLKECPRYSQAGNAVPPFLAEFVGQLVAELRERFTPSSKAESRTQRGMTG